MEIPSTEPLADSINRMIETLYDREKMITEYQTELHRQNKFLEAVINSLSDGLVVIDDEHKAAKDRCVEYESTDGLLESVLVFG